MLFFQYDHIRKKRDSGISGNAIPLPAQTGRSEFPEDAARKPIATRQK